MPIIEQHAIEQINWNTEGLIPAIAQEANSGKVLMLAWMNKEALNKTLETGYAVYWSRSRHSLWFKGKTSGHTQRVLQLWLDCDQDALLLSVDAKQGIACHTGKPSCFFNPLYNPTTPHTLPLDPPHPTDQLTHYSVDSDSSTSSTFSQPILHHLAALINSRKDGDPAHSYIARLFSLGDDAILKKIGEEATEVVLAAKDAAHMNNGEEVQKLIYEMADLWFHCLITLGRFNLGPDAIFKELERRNGQSGLEEKAARDR